MYLSRYEVHSIHYNAYKYLPGSYARAYVIVGILEDAFA